MFNKPTNITKSCCTPGMHNHGGNMHQWINNELMRDFDPCDPANKNRTFVKMVEAANRKHLNPGEQSFHYYVDVDNEVHGFIAIGNICDRLPHIIISDTGREQSMFSILNEVESMVQEILVDKSEELDEFKKQVGAQLDEFKCLISKLDIDDIKNELDSFRDEFNNIQEEINQTIKDATDDLNNRVSEIETTVDNKLTEIDKVIENVDTQVSEKLEVIDAKINDVETSVNDAIDTLTTTVDNKLDGIDKQVEDKVAESINSDEVKDTIKDLVVAEAKDNIGNIVNDKINEILPEETQQAIEIINDNPEAVQQLIDNSVTIIKQTNDMPGIVEKVNTLTSANDELSSNVDALTIEVQTIKETIIQDNQSKWEDADDILAELLEEERPRDDSPLTGPPDLTDEERKEWEVNVNPQD